MLPYLEKVDCNDPVKFQSQYESRKYAFQAPIVALVSQSQLKQLGKNSPMKYNYNILLTTFTLVSLFWACHYRRKFANKSLKENLTFSETRITMCCELVNRLFALVILQWYRDEVVKCDTMVFMLANTCWIWG